MTDLNFADKLKAHLLDSNREPDGLLHCSGLAHCEYSQIQQAVGEVSPKELEIIDLIVMMTGTLWHKYIQESFPDYIKQPEMDLTPWLTTGWAGSFDGLWLDPKTNCVTLIDIKTMNGEGMRYIKGVKPEHKWQVSAYYYAVEQWWMETKPNFGMANSCSILYIPVSRAKDYSAEPIEVNFFPHSRQKTQLEMNLRAGNLEFYKKQGLNNGKYMPLDITTVRSSGGWKEIREKRNWWVPYCPALDCPCSAQKGKGTIGKIDPGGNITTNEYSRYTAEELGEILNES